MGDIRLIRYAAVHDCGPMMQPELIVRGQIQPLIRANSIAQGLWVKPLSSAKSKMGQPNPIPLYDDSRSPGQPF